ncbi:YopX family protein [Bacillus subtilis]|uniref:YopX family protein n=1 Tax=Bacillus subtilis TaxID=1423 RepID=UPI0023ED089C|nr:YopX family protein [Bacillus subtilis]MDF4200449.1 YopX family protein [Bacillus subtilis]MDF4218692.1 YopX family protein [Bacillus subtilis]
MREIKFRGKPIEDYGDVKWFYGNAVLNYDDKLAYIEADRQGYVPVEWESIGQYTGLKDRNGREIYEGDILQISNKENKDYHMEVLWTGQGFGYRIIRNETKRSGYIVGHHSERGLNFYNRASEVIGNIYEDPELLEASHASK